MNNNLVDYYLKFPTHLAKLYFTSDHALFLVMQQYTMEVCRRMFLLFLEVTVVSCSIDLLAKLIIRHGQQSIYPTDICLVNSSHFTQNFIKTLPENVAAHLTVNSTNRLLKCSVYLISVDLNEFNHSITTLDNLYLTDAWNPSGLFVFVYESQWNADTVQMYRRLPEQFGLQKSALQSPSHLASYDIYTKQLTILNTSVEIDVSLEDSPFNAHGYELRTIAEPVYPYIGQLKGNFSGPFVQILNALSTASNITIRWVPKKSLIPDYTAMVHSDKVNVAFFKNLPAPYTMQVTVQDRSTICLFIFERPIDNYFILLLSPFTDLVWIFIAGLTLIGLLLRFVYRKHFPRNLLLMTFFGLHVPSYRLTRSERSTLLVLNILLFILSAAYITKILETMCSYKYERHIQSIREFEQSGIPVYAESVAEQARIKAIYPSWKVVVRRQGEQLPENNAMTVRCAVAEFFEQSPFNVDWETGLRRLYVMREPLFWDNVVHSFAKSNPLVERFGHVWDQLYEAGIWGHLVRVQVKRFFRKSKSFRETVLRFPVLISMWWILLYGHCGSVIVLLGEIIFSYLFKKTK